MITKIDSNTDEAVYWLQQGELVGIPTETVYGLAANATSEAAIQKLYAVKRRPQQNPLIVHVHSIAQLEQYVSSIPPMARILLEQYTPGPLTFLFRQHHGLPALVNNGLAEMAFRIPSHPMAQALLQKLDFPLVAPSANQYTTISPTLPGHVLKNFDGEIPYILDGGPCNYGIESTVIGFAETGIPVIYRPGAITETQIKNFTGQVQYFKQKDMSPSPGLSSFHYAPRTPLFLVANILSLPSAIDPAKTGTLSLNTKRKDIPDNQQVLLSVEHNLQEAAHNLYKGLHYLDELGLSVIFAEKLPNIGLGPALNDRLQRAARIFRSNQK